MNLPHRQYVLLFAVLGLVAPVAGAVPAGATPHSGAAPAPVQVRLISEPGSVVSSAAYHLGPDALARDAGTRSFRTPRLGSSSYRMVALTWRGAAPAALHVRNRAEGRWSTWRKLAPLIDLPDATSGEGNGIHGTELLWVGASDGVQVGVRAGVRGRLPEGLSLQLIDPGSLDSDSEVVAHPHPAVARSSRAGAPQPLLRFRVDWGADESWRNGGPYYGRTIQQVHIHHTATGNQYSMADVPALIRGMYSYHTHTLGWSDIGYNFLVDRFGRAWVGRAGGPSNVVRGAHTLGFNETSTGISVIGNFEDARPNSAVISTIVRLAAWKLDRFHRAPAASARVYSHGSDKYREGRWVTLRVIDGHRDTNYTACPGEHLYSQLPKIRYRTQQRVNNW